MMATVQALGWGGGGPPSGRLPVLLVEDNPGDVVLMRRALGAGRGGFELRPVARLAAAIEELERTVYEVVLLDLGLPDSQGLGTLTRLLATESRVPVVVTTGFDDEDVAVQAVRLGAQDYVVKGRFDGGSLVRILRYAIERARIEREQRESAQQFHHLFHEGPAPMWILGLADLAILAANRAAVEGHGWSQDEWRELAVADMVPGSERAAFLAAVDRVRELGTGSRVGEDRPYILLTRSGSRREAQLTLCPLPYRGRPALLMVSNDVTEQRRLQGQLFQAAKMEAIGQLASGVAHDFNNLLGVIRGYAELLASAANPARVPERAGQILGAAEQGAGLVRQLLTFSRNQPLEPCPLDLGALLDEIGDVLRRLIGSRIETLMRPGEGVERALADPVQVQQVLMNLAINARDAMPEGGTLTIETENALLDEAAAAALPEARPGAYVLLRVSDTGTGMDPEIVQHIFEPFYTTKSLGRGTGLGLATVYGVVRQSGGFVTVRSELGRGSVFEVHLPVAGNEPSP